MRLWILATLAFLLCSPMYSQGFTLDPPIMQTTTATFTLGPPSTWLGVPPSSTCEVDWLVIADNNATGQAVYKFGIVVRRIGTAGAQIGTGALAEKIVKETAAATSWDARVIQQPNADPTQIAVEVQGAAGVTVDWLIIQKLAGTCQTGPFVP